MEFAKAGFHVIGYDVSERVCKLLMRGESHIQDVPASDVAALVRSGRFEATTDESAARARRTRSRSPCRRRCRKTRDPDMSYVIAAADAIDAPGAPGMLVVLESTTYPGTTREVLLPALTKRGLTVGKDVFLAFSPERVDPGNPMYHTKNTPKVVGGITAGVHRDRVGAVRQLHRHHRARVDAPKRRSWSSCSRTRSASVNIGLVNEMAIVCDKLGVDVWEVIDAAATKPFGFMKFTPGPGIGGHCIPLDPHYLAWKMRTLNYKTRFIDLASEINSQMPALRRREGRARAERRSEAGERQQHPRARRRLQARHRRRSRKPGARRDPSARGARRRR